MSLPTAIAAPTFVYMADFTRNKLTDIDVLRQFYSGTVTELTEHQEKRRKRLLIAQSMMTQGQSNQKIIKVLRKDYGISDTQAWRDTRDAIKLYGDMRKAEKEGIRWIIYEMALKGVRKALKAKDLKSYNAAIKNLISITGVDKESADLPDFEKLQPSIIVAVLPEGMEEKMTKLLNKGSVNLNEFIEDAEYEIIDTERGTPTKSTDRQTSQEE